MKRKLFSILIAVALVASFGLVTAVPAAAEDPATREVSKWTEYAENPVFTGIIRAYYPCVLAIGGTYHMWYTDKDGTGYQVAYTTSADGVDWGTTSMVTGLAGTPNHVVVVNVETETSPHYRIWYADAAIWPYDVELLRTAESGDGVTWINDQPIVQANNLIREDDSEDDPAYQWLYGSYGPGAVLYNPDGHGELNEMDPMGNKYVMYYDQYTRYGLTGVQEVTMLAISVDGINWKRYGDAPVILGDSGEWDEGYVYAWTVLNSDDGYHMWYSGGIIQSHEGIGYATSSDGLAWTKDANNPIFHMGDGVAWRAKCTYTPMVIEDGGIYKMWFSGKDAEGNYAIGYATIPSPLPDYYTIQAAIDDADSGDIINVAAGVYSEWQDNGYGQSAGNIIDKPLHLQGSGDDCIIRGKTGTASHMPDSPILWVKADNVEIDHFKFDGATYTEEEPKGLRSCGILSAWKVGSTDYAATNLNVHHNTFVFIGTAVTQDRGGGGDITVAYNTMVRETRSVWYKPGGATPGSYVDKTLGGGGVKFDYVVGGSVHDNTGIETPGVGIFLHGCGNLTIGPNNVVSAPNTTDPSDIGIHIQGCDNIVVTGNTVSNFTAGPKEHYNNGTTGAGIRIISSNENVTIDGNQLSNNTVGVLVTGASGSPEIHRNNIEGNTEFGVLNCTSWIGEDQTYTPASVTIDAKYNWWGHPSGPSHELSNGKWVGKGDKVSDNVDYKPWLHKSKEKGKKKPAYAQSVVLDNTGDYGWNTFSTPIFLDDEADTWEKLYDLTDLDYSVAYRFDSDIQEFVLLTIDDEYAINPGEGFFIKMDDVGSLTILYSTEEKLIPPSRPLTAGWNLIGLASLKNMDVEDAFPSIATVPGLAGYSQVVSPIGNVSPGPVLADGIIYVGESYWVYMLGARTLAGFTMTPVEWMP